MKSLFRFSIQVCFLTMVLSKSFGQNLPEQNAIGNWSGKLDLSTSKVEMIFKISFEKGQLVSKLDVPMQGAKDLPVKETIVMGDSIKLNVTMVMGTFAGKFITDSIIEGTWKQSGFSLPLVLKKGISKPAVLRPQTPKPPFPYVVQEVEYLNPKSGLKLAGTFTLPENAQNCPAAILISGSGAQDRDETIFEHKPFLVIADFLTRNGIAVLRIDDRGVGGSEGKTSEATSADFATDVVAGVQFLKTKLQIDASKIGLIGHSEGGLVAPMVASNSNEIAFIVLLAGPGWPGKQIIYEQGKLLNKAAGMNDAQAEETRKTQEVIFDIVISETDSLKRIEKLREVFSNGMYLMMNDELKKSIDNQIKTVDNTWFRFFLQYDPYPALTKVTCPVLALNGEKDLQVPPKENLLAIEKALTEGGNKHFTMMELAGLNHLFQNCETGAITEYAEIKETVSPQVLEILNKWISKYVLKN